MTPQVAQVSTKSEGSTEFTSTNPVPSPTCRATILPDASEYPQEKLLKKASASQARLEKELKDEIMQKNIKNLAVYEK